LVIVASIHIVHTDFGAFSASYAMVTIFLRGVKRPECEADHSPLSSAKLKNAWSCTCTPQFVFVAWYLVKHRGNFACSFPPRMEPRSPKHRILHVETANRLIFFCAYRVRSLVAGDCGVAHCCRRAVMCLRIAHSLPFII